MVLLGQMTVMLVLFEITDLAAAETLLVSIPESLGLLAFGIGLVAVAVLIRWFLGRGESQKGDGKA